ncbi:WecB/TagA/CpsF family glycosyltransferase [Alteromonas lipolytica]|uniref:STAS domain-containing protein n=1 Tax=Alteromonas lipolytica TaxID=1856405 RepID=A0A1E8FAW8_9ALTE|nr:WecB/TagA/CpsF family glycosyltransferase [Alteromonas lipolytica]OFI33055.1 hypothetical protein BFC17_01940 [Alteromonas lipolytica]GGF62938.1 WecB/TagA/CpsF family glycosyl transferase [Alteromonas lipolytica]
MTSKAFFSPPAAAAPASLSRSVIKDNYTPILGIPIDNLTLEETTDAVFELIKQYPLTQRPSFVATVNVDFLVNAHAWLPGQLPRHPELLDILRNADIVTADGMPLVWLSKLLGRSLKQRVTGADLVPALCLRAAQENASVYLLGGREQIALQAADKLKSQYPGLTVAGVNSPFVTTEGVNIDNEANDQQIVDAINQARPDILFIGFGNPKQEIWFQRNKHKLNVPVSLGIGGTFEFIVGSVNRAPRWMQASGLEWIYRITQDPKRLIGRYLTGIAKLAIMTTPMLLNSRPGARQHGNAAANEQANAALDILDQDIAYPDICALSADHYHLICLPEEITTDWVERNAIFITQMLNQQRPLLLDFTDAKYFEPGTEHLFLQMFRHSTNNHQQVYVSGLNNPQLIRQLKSFRVYDMFQFKVFSSFEKILFLIGDNQESNAVHYQSRAGIFHITITGTIYAQDTRPIDISAISAASQGRPLLLDISRVTDIDNRGLAQLVCLAKHCQQHHQQLVMLGANAAFRQRLSAAGLATAFAMTDTYEQAHRLLR